MLLAPRLPSFTGELFRVSAAALEKVALAPSNHRTRAQEKAGRHFSTPDPNWNEFVKNLRSKNFREVVAEHGASDEKLKAYVKNFGGYVASKDVVARVPSDRSGKKYTLKKVGDRLGCNCGDWQYVHSVQGGDCKHIERFQSQLVKKSYANLLLGSAATLGLSKRRNTRLRTQGLAASMNKKQLREEESQGPRAF